MSGSDSPAVLISGREREREKLLGFVPLFTICVCAYEPLSLDREKREISTD